MRTIKWFFQEVVENYLNNSIKIFLNFLPKWCIKMSSDDEKDFQLIQETLENYFTGVIEGNYSKIVKAWHKKGNRLLVESKTTDIIFQNSPASKEYSSLKPRPEIKQTAIIEAIDKTGIAASVRLKWFIESPRGKGTCTDYLLLLKERESWTIVTKVSFKE